MLFCRLRDVKSRLSVFGINLAHITLTYARKLPLKVSGDVQIIKDLVIILVIRLKRNDCIEQPSTAISRVTRDVAHAPGSRYERSAERVLKQHCEIESIPSEAASIT